MTQTGGSDFPFQVFLYRDDEEGPSIANTTMLMLFRPFLVVEHAALQVKSLRSGGVIRTGVSNRDSKL